MKDQYDYNSLRKNIEELDYPEARKKVEILILKNPKDYRAFELKGYISYRNKDFKQAYKSYLRAALYTNDNKIKSKLKYNQANSLVQEVKVNKNEELSPQEFKILIAQLKKSSNMYQDAIFLDKEIKGAHANKLIIEKHIKDLIKKLPSSEVPLFNKVEIIDQEVIGCILPVTSSTDQQSDKVKLALMLKSANSPVHHFSQTPNIDCVVEIRPYGSVSILNQIATGEINTKLENRSIEELKAYLQEVDLEFEALETQANERDSHELNSVYMNGFLQLLKHKGDISLAIGKLYEKAGKTHKSNQYMESARVEYYAPVATYVNGLIKNFTPYVNKNFFPYHKSYPKLHSLFEDFSVTLLGKSEKLSKEKYVQKILSKKRKDGFYGAIDEADAILNFKVHYNKNNVSSTVSNDFGHGTYKLILDGFNLIGEIQENTIEICKQKKQESNDFVDLELENLETKVEKVSNFNDSKNQDGVFEDDTKAQQIFIQAQKIATANVEKLKTQEVSKINLNQTNAANIKVRKLQPKTNKKITAPVKNDVKPLPVPKKELLENIKVTNSKSLNKLLISHLKVVFPKLTTDEKTEIKKAIANDAFSLDDSLFYIKKYLKTSPTKLLNQLKEGDELGKLELLSHVARKGKVQRSQFVKLLLEKSVYNQTTKASDEEKFFWNLTQKEFEKYGVKLYSSGNYQTTKETLETLIAKEKVTYKEDGYKPDLGKKTESGDDLLSKTVEELKSYFKNLLNSNDSSTSVMDRVSEMTNAGKYFQDKKKLGDSSDSKPLIDFNHDGTKYIIGNYKGIGNSSTTPLKNPPKDPPREKREKSTKMVTLRHAIGNDGRIIVPELSKVQKIRIVDSNEDVTQLFLTQGKRDPAGNYRTEKYKGKIVEVTYWPNTTTDLKIAKSSDIEISKYYLENQNCSVNLDKQPALKKFISDLKTNQGKKPSGQQRIKVATELTKWLNQNIYYSQTRDTYLEYKKYSSNLTDDESVMDLMLRIGRGDCDVHNSFVGCILMNEFNIPVRMGTGLMGSDKVYGDEFHGWIQIWAPESGGWINWDSTSSNMDPTGKRIGDGGFNSEKPTASSFGFGKLNLPKFKMKLWEESEMTPRELKKAATYLIGCLGPVINKQLIEGNIDLKLNSVATSNNANKIMSTVIKKHCGIQLSKKDYKNLKSGNVSPKPNDYFGMQFASRFTEVPIIDIYLTLLGNVEKEEYIEKVREIALSSINTESEFDKDKRKKLFKALVEDSLSGVYMPPIIREKFITEFTIKKYNDQDKIFHQTHRENAELMSNGLQSVNLTHVIYHPNDKKINEYEKTQIYNLFIDRMDERLDEFLNKSPITKEDYGQITSDYKHFIIIYSSLKSRKLKGQELGDDIYPMMDRFKLVMDKMLNDFEGGGEERLSLFLEMHEALGKVPYHHDFKKTLRYKNYMGQFYTKIEPLIYSNVDNIVLLKKLEKASLVGPSNFINKFIPLHLEKLKNNELTGLVEEKISQKGYYSAYSRWIIDYSNLSEWKDYINGTEESPPGLPKFNSVLQSMYLIKSGDPSPVIKAITKDFKSIDYNNIVSDSRNLQVGSKVHSQVLRSFSDIQETPLNGDAALKILNQIYNFDIIDEAAKQREANGLKIEINDKKKTPQDFKAQLKEAKKIKEKISLNPTAVIRSLFIHAKKKLGEEKAIELRPYYSILLTAKKRDRRLFLEELTKNNEAYKSAQIPLLLEFFEYLVIEKKIYTTTTIDALSDILNYNPLQGNKTSRRVHKEKAMAILQKVPPLKEEDIGKSLYIADLEFILQANENDFWEDGFDNQFNSDEVRFYYVLTDAFTKQKGNFSTSKFLREVRNERKKYTFAQGRNGEYHLIAFLHRIIENGATRSRGLQILNQLKMIKKAQSDTRNFSSIIANTLNVELASSYKKSVDNNVGSTSKNKNIKKNLVQKGEPAFLTELKTHKMTNNYNNIGGHDVLLSAVLVDSEDRGEKLKDYFNSPIFAVAPLYSVKKINQILQFGKNNDNLEAVIPELFKAIERTNELNDMNRGFKDTMTLFSLYQYARPEDKKEIAEILKRNDIEFDRIAHSFEYLGDKGKEESSYLGLGASWEGVKKFGEGLDSPKKSKVEKDLEFDQIFALTRLEQESGIVQPFSKKMDKKLTSFIDQKLSDSNEQINGQLVLKASYNKLTAVINAQKGLEITQNSSEHPKLLKSVNDMWERQFKIISRDEIKTQEGPGNFRSLTQTEFLRDTVSILNTKAFKNKELVIDSNEVNRLFEINNDSVDNLTIEEQIGHLFIIFNKLYEKGNSEISNEFLLSEANKILLKLSPRLRAQVIAKLFTNGKVISNQQRLFYLTELGMHDEVLPYLDRRSESDGSSLNSYNVLLTAVDDILLSNPGYKESTQPYRLPDNSNNVMLRADFRKRFISPDSELLLDQNLKNRVDFRNSETIFEVAKFDTENFGIRFSHGDWDISQSKKIDLMTKAMASGIYSPKLITTIPVSRWRKQILGQKEKQKLEESLTLSFIHSNLTKHYGEKWFGDNGTTVLVDKFTKEFNQLPQENKMTYLRNNRPPFDPKELEFLNIQLAPYGLIVKLPFKPKYKWRDDSTFTPANL